MAGSIIERFGTHIEGDRIIHDDRPSTWRRADTLAGRRLDRRKRYAIIPDREFGDLHELVRWSGSCSGCSDAGGYGSQARGCGCRECGYTGRVRRAQWVPWPAS